MIKIATLTKDGGVKIFPKLYRFGSFLLDPVFFNVSKDTTVHACRADDLSVLVGWTGDNHRLDTSICVLFPHEQSGCGCPSFLGSCRS